MLTGLGVTLVAGREVEMKIPGAMDFVYRWA
jgi:hypothetical protein